jgi:hypothetical protein
VGLVAARFNVVSQHVPLVTEKHFKSCLFVCLFVVPIKLS